MSVMSFIIRGFMRVLSRVALSGTLARQRRFAQMGGRLMILPRGTRIRAEQMSGLPVRWVTPARPVEGRLVYYIHGGGWVFGLIPYYNLLLSYIARECRSNLIAVDYRLAPEHPFPAALDDSLAVYRALLEVGHPPGQMAVMGDSAGGDLTLAVMLAARARGLPLPACAVCLSPATDLSSRGDSYTTNRVREALLPESFVKFARAAYLGDHDPSDPLISPALGDLRGLPSLLIQVGGDEILLSDAKKLSEAALSAGVNACLRIYPGLWHVFQTTIPYLPEARAAVKEIGLFVQSST